MALALPRFAVIQSQKPPKNYLRYMREDGGSHGTLQFSGEEILSPFSKFEIERAKNDNAFVHIRCCYNNKYWVAKSSSDPCIIAGADEPNEDQSQWSYDTTTTNLDTLFYPVKVGDNVVALHNLGNNKFCKRLTTEGKTDCLNAGVDTISKEARLVVEELVVSREIYNVNFHLLDARIYNQSIVTMVTKTDTNDTQESNTATLKFLRNETKSSTWTGTVSFKLGVKTEIQTGIPFIVEGKVEVSAEFTGSYQWGETVSTENQVETEYTFSVPPMSKVTVSLLATQGSCDVPYSYTQRDTLMNGEQVIHNFDDGVYTGINSFNFFYQTK
ncbi:hypothetical protein RHGRI_012946 [Rhododendron griersonianum]|uniref:Agglutinin domain-containing protein n=1 Tax=Rhododendron griersonianum TaxID=479676 RepID=A0AAV6K3Z9_9ERIC|nr:hypothetical protein RHGRI_012946 [Rhododendron griersonianum]